MKAEIEGALRHRFTIQQILADEAALKRFVTAYAYEEEHIRLVKNLTKVHHFCTVLP